MQLKISRDATKTRCSQINKLVSKYFKISWPLNESKVTNQGGLSYILLTNIPEISEAEYDERWLLTRIKPKPDGSGYTAFLLVMTRILLRNN